MKKHRFILFVLFINVLSSSCQDSSEYKFEKELLEEFELMNLCHCHEYLMLRNYDYVAWSSIEAKKNRIEEEKQLVFGQYKSGGQFKLYFQEKYDSTLFYKYGISVVLDINEMNFKRLDSIYYEPLVQHYVRKEVKTNPVPYLGIRDNSFFWDCFFRVKEIPLEQELNYFINSNRKIKK